MERSSSCNRIVQQVWLTWHLRSNGFEDCRRRSWTSTDVHLCREIRHFCSSLSTIVRGDVSLDVVRMLYGEQ